MPQYFINVEKGFTVTYGKNDYRVQDDGKGYLHIIVFEGGKRKKIGIKSLQQFEPGTEADYVFNGWFEMYEDYELFKSFADAERMWIK
jgi:hypothetical protein